MQILRTNTGTMKIDSAKKSDSLAASLACYILVAAFEMLLHWFMLMPHPLSRILVASLYL